MQFLKKHLFFFLALSLAIGIVSCSKDDDKKTAGPAAPAGNNLGTATITMSGHVEGTKTGMAYFDLITIEGLGTSMWSISSYDTSPQTYSLDLSAFIGAAQPAQPAVGTYRIGVDMNNPTGVYFIGSLSLVENGNYADTDDYDSNIYGEGTLIITKSDDKEISGTFTFPAEKYDDDMNLVGTINISGSFSAAP